MSGHNKFSKIKHKKAASDAEKSKIFGKIARFISVESKKSKGDVNSPGLKNAIEKARAANMPKDKIENAVRKGAGGDISSFENITYESYGPGGCALIIETLTDNRNKAAAEVKHILSKHGYSLATPGSAMWAFVKEPNINNFQPTITIELSGEEGEKLSALVEELENNDEVREVFTNAK